MNCIYYKSGYKYQLVRDYTIDLPIVGTTLDTQFLMLASNGLLTIRSGYAWDGPSGPTIDTRNFMRGSLVHDALYQLIREGHLNYLFRKTADELLHKIVREDGMNIFRAQLVYLGVRFGGGPAADPSHERPTLVAGVCNG